MRFLSLGLIPTALALASCEMMNAPLNSSGSFDPLAPPGSGAQRDSASFGPELSPGAFVTATIPNTAFYKNRPKGTEDADKLLTIGTNMKIVSSDTSYTKVELDSGEVGWVPSVMITTPNVVPENYPIDGTYQVYPPLPGGSLEPLPVLDPNGLPPEGAIPTIIDPDAPAPAADTTLKIDPIPDLKPVEPAVEEKVEPKEGELKIVEPKEDESAPE